MVKREGAGIAEAGQPALIVFPVAERRSIEIRRFPGHHRDTRCAKEPPPSDAVHHAPRESTTTA